MGGDIPVLKKCFRDERYTIEVFERELEANIDELRHHGLFFSFTTDPLIFGTNELTIEAICFCLRNDVPVKVLTKCVDYIGQLKYAIELNEWDKSMVAFGFTLTGHDELEPNASTNAERIDAMRKLHDAGYKTFASIEPIIDFECSREMIVKTMDFCDLYKIGLESGKKYDKADLATFIHAVLFWKIPVYFKDSLLKQAGISRESLPANCIDRDYNLFNP